MPSSNGCRPSNVSSWDLHEALSLHQLLEKLKFLRKSARSNDTYMNTSFLDELQQSIQDQNPALRKELLKKIKALSGVQANSYDQLIEAFERPGLSPRVRMAVAWLLAQSGYRRAAKVLSKAFIEEKSDLVWEWAKAIGILKGKSAVKPLIHALGSESVEHRAAAAYALGMMHESNAVEPLIKALTNTKESPTVKGYAAEALAYIRDQRSVEPLLSGLRDNSPEVRFWAAFALGEIGDARALTELRRVAQSDRGKCPGMGSVRLEAQRACELLEKGGVKRRPSRRSNPRL